MILFFDVETTGKAYFQAPPGAEHQPRIVQLAMLGMDESARESFVFSALIRPSGFVIPKEAEAIHGISTEAARSGGISMTSALEIFWFLKSKADTTLIPWMASASFGITKPLGRISALKTKLSRAD